MRPTLLVAIACAVWPVACAGSPPLLPTPVPAATTAAAPASVGLMVRVLTRGTEQPITGATVFENGEVVGQTNAGGELRTIVLRDVEFRISVTAAGFVGLGALGTVAGEERWTFYLERQP